MAAVIDELLDSQDGFEIARDAVAAILAEEIANQQALAANASADVSLYQLDVYAERVAPLENWRDDPTAAPVVSVWIPRYVPRSGGSTVDDERGEATLYLDVFAAGQDADSMSGHTAGDYQARVNLHRVIRLIRQILMSGQYTYLGSPRKAAQWCYGREIKDVEIHEPRRLENTAQWVATARISFSVDLKMSQPQWPGEVAEGQDVIFKRDSDGKVLAKATYDAS